MNFIHNFKKQIFNHRKSFQEKALQLFHYQANNNPLYQKYIKNLGYQITNVDSIDKIPFLPIQFFKKHRICSGSFIPEAVFSSSGTTGTPSNHYIADLNLYKKSIALSFDLFFRKIKNRAILALLPSYLDRKGSSLIYMVNYLMKLSGHPDSGFYLYDYKHLYETLKSLNSKKEKIILIGVSFALIDFGAKFNLDLKNQVVIETGGMKGRKEEIVREELHEILKKAFNKEAIQSEYSMTELLSQAYSMSDGRFYTPPWMSVLIRDQQDPFGYVDIGETGVINVIDLANIHSCAFIATEDLGKKNRDGSFEVLGRMDNSEMRGCTLLI